MAQKENMLLEALNESIKRTEIDSKKIAVNEYRSKRQGKSFCIGLAEEKNKLNLLIDEYRKENDKCATHIQELQQKLNSTQKVFHGITHRWSSKY